MVLDIGLAEDLAQDALLIALERVLAEIAPDEPEVHGLVALMEIQSSRFRARVSPSGEPVLLLDQNRALWNHLLIRQPIDGELLTDLLRQASAAL